MFQWLASKLAAAVTEELRRAGTLRPVPPSAPPVTPAPTCHIRTVQYENGTIESEHSMCHGPRDLDALIRDDALVIKDTAH